MDIYHTPQDSKTAFIAFHKLVIEWRWIAEAGVYNKSAILSIKQSSFPRYDGFWNNVGMSDDIITLTESTSFYFEIVTIHHYIAHKRRLLWGWGDGCSLGSCCLIILVTNVSWMWVQRLIYLFFLLMGVIWIIMLDKSALFRSTGNEIRFPQWVLNIYLVFSSSFFVCLLILFVKTSNVGVHSLDILLMSLINCWLPNTCGISFECWSLLNYKKCVCQSYLQTPSYGTKGEWTRDTDPFINIDMS